MKANISLLAVATLMFCLSCRKEKKEDSTDPTTGPTVYVTGSYTDANDKDLAAVWINGSIKTIAQNFSYDFSYCDAATYKGEKIYMAGHSNTGTKIWEYDISGNSFSVVHNLSDSYSNIITDLNENNGTFYTSLHHYGELADKDVGYYQNGTYHMISDSAYNSCLRYYNGDIYMGGYVEDKAHDYQSTIWKNGIAYPITTSKNARISDFDISDGYLYATGLDYKSGYRAMVWKAPLSNLNSFTETELLPASTDNVSTSKVIRVFNGDVYVGGETSVFMSGYQRATYWKNGNIVPLETGNSNSTVKDIFVYDKDVYVLTSDNTNQSIAKVWKNGVATALNDNSTIIRPSSLFVK